LLNTLQTIAGWTEGFLIGWNRFTKCDSSILLKTHARQGGLPFGDNDQCQTLRWKHHRKLFRC
jgi:hypothetical protein